MDAGAVETTLIDIADDEPGPELTIDDVTLQEGDYEHTVDVPLHLSSPAGSYVYAWCLPHDGTARAGADFRLLGSTAIFEPGQTSATCQLRMIGNLVPQPSRTFTISTNPVTGPVKVVRGTAVATIVDDDVATPPTPDPPPVIPALQLWFDGPSFRMSSGTSASLPLNANLLANVVLTSSDSSVVDVTASMTAPGPMKLFALKPGTAAITAKSGDATATVVVEVTPPAKRRAAR